MHWNGEKKKSWENFRPFSSMAQDPCASITFQWLVAKQNSIQLLKINRNNSFTAMMMWHFYHVAIFITMSAPVYRIKASHWAHASNKMATDYIWWYRNVYNDAKMEPNNWKKRFYCHYTHWLYASHSLISFCWCHMLKMWLLCFFLGQNLVVDL